MIDDIVLDDTQTILVALFIKNKKAQSEDPDCALRYLNKNALL